MAFPSFNREITSKKRMVKEYYPIQISFVKHFRKKQKVQFKVKSPALMLDFVFDEDLEIDGLRVDAGSWRIVWQPAGNRKIINQGNGYGYLVSFIIQENHFPEWPLDWVTSEGMVSAAAVYMILNMLSASKAPGKPEEILMDVYFHGLMSLLYIQKGKRINIRFGELKVIYEMGEWLSDCVGKLPTPAEMVLLSGLPKARFRSGFQALYGLSAQKMIQHLRMKNAYKSWVMKKQSFALISEESDYVHTTNFATAFRAYFGFTPTEAARYDFA